MLRRFVMIAWFMLAGCQGVVGPAQRRCLTDPIDGPCLTIDEQEQRRRARLAVPLNSPTLGPRTYAEERNR